MALQLSTYRVGGKWRHTGTPHVTYVSRKRNSRTARKHGMRNFYIGIDRCTLDRNTIPRLHVLMDNY